MCEIVVQCEVKRISDLESQSATSEPLSETEITEARNELIQLIFLVLLKWSHLTQEQVMSDGDFVITHNTSKSEINGEEIFQSFTAYITNLQGLFNELSFQGTIYMDSSLAHELSPFTSIGEKIADQLDLSRQNPKYKYAFDLTPKLEKGMPRLFFHLDDKMAINPDRPIDKSDNTSDDGDQPLSDLIPE
jgi:hypothetical protein